MQDLFKNGDEIRFFKKRGCRLGKTKKLVNDLIDPVDLLFNDLEIFLTGIFGWKILCQGMDKDVNAGQGIANLVGDARCQLS